MVYINFCRINTLVNEYLSSPLRLSFSQYLERCHASATYKRHGHYQFYAATCHYSHTHQLYDAHLLHIEDYFIYFRHII